MSKLCAFNQSHPVSISPHTHSCVAFRQLWDHRKFSRVCFIPADVPRKKNENVLKLYTDNNVIPRYLSHDISLRTEEDGVAVKAEIDHLQR